MPPLTVTLMSKLTNAWVDKSAKRLRICKAIIFSVQHFFVYWSPPKHNKDFKGKHCEPTLLLQRSSMLSSIAHKFHEGIELATTRGSNLADLYSWQ